MRRLLALLALALPLTGASFPIHFTGRNTEGAPCPGDSTFGDSTVTERPETSGLAFYRVYGVRYRDMDTLTIGDIPAVGPFPQSVIDTLDLAPGTMGQLWVTAFDKASNESCPGSWLTFTVPAVDEGMGPAPGLVGTYYIGTDLTVVAATRVDSTVAFTWGDGPAWADGSLDNFSARWVGYLTVPTSGDYTIYVGSDDGRRAWLDGPQIIAGWGSRWDESNWTGTLTKGRHALVLEYEELTGGALCQLSWSGPGVPREVVPGWALTH